MNVTNHLSSTASIIHDLKLSGGCGYEILHDQVIINVAEISNLRETNGISGTLSLELWALEQPYNGDGFQGVALAATNIGELLDQHFLADQYYTLTFKAPLNGTWYFTLMLREWDGYRYVTRDYANFALPYIVNSKPFVSRSEIDNVITVDFTGNKTVSEVIGFNKTTNHIAEDKKEPTTEDITISEPSEKEIIRKSVVTKTPSKKTSVKNTTQPRAKKSTPVKTVAEAKVSINNATLDQLEAVKGMSQKLAQNIIAARPYTQLEEVLKVKGMGPKLLQKMHDLLSL